MLDWLWSIIIGGVAGWLADLLVPGVKVGILGAIIAGILGGVLGKWLFGLLGLATTGIIGILIACSNRSYYSSVGLSRHREKIKNLFVIVQKPAHVGFCVFKLLA